MSRRRGGVLSGPHAAPRSAAKSAGPPHRGVARRAVSLKAVSFALVGLINTAVDATIFFLLLAYVTSSLVIANVAAWLVANTGSYVMNSLTTFSAELRNDAHPQFVAYVRSTGLAFFDAAYLRGLPEAQAWLRSGSLERASGRVATLTSR